MTQSFTYRPYDDGLESCKSFDHQVIHLRITEERCRELLRNITPLRIGRQHRTTGPDSHVILMRRKA
jgi:hypothetical protein